MKTKSPAVAYLLALAGLLFICGLHRFYLRRYWTGALWLLTFGLFGVGQLIDLFLIPGMCRQKIDKPANKVINNIESTQQVAPEATKCLEFISGNKPSYFTKLAEGDVFGILHKYYGICRFSSTASKIDIVKINGKSISITPGMFTCSLFVDTKHNDRRSWTIKSSEGAKFKFSELETMFTKDQYDQMHEALGASESGWSKMGKMLGKVQDITG